MLILVRIDLFPKIIFLFQLFVRSSMKWFQKNNEDAAPRLLSLSPIRNYDSGDPDYSAERYYHLTTGPRRSRLGRYSFNVVFEVYNLTVAIFKY